MIMIICIYNLPSPLNLTALYINVYLSFLNSSRRMLKSPIPLYNLPLPTTLPQHYMSMFTATLSIPILLAPAMCMGDDHVGKSEIIGTLFVTSGVITLMQNYLGVRLDHYSSSYLPVCQVSLLH